MPDVRPSALAEESGAVDAATVVEHDDDNDDNNAAADDDDDVDDNDDDAIFARLPPRLKTRLNNLRAKRAELEDLVDLHVETLGVLHELEREITGVKWGASDYEDSDDRPSSSVPSVARG